MNYKDIVTVFTPTYNRGYIITNLYNSLKRQTSKRFEWLIVDDGSTDDTDMVIQSMIKETNEFCIRYYKKENGGKCSAINQGLDLAEGFLFFTVDSDDYLTDDAIEKILNWEKDIPDEGYCGLCANIGTSILNTKNNLFEEDYYDCSLLARYTDYESKYHINGERAYVFYTDIHGKYKYPLMCDEKFMTEAVVWNRIANDGYMMRCFNDIIWIYEYLEDGLTLRGHKLFKDNPFGYGLWTKERIVFMKKGFLYTIKNYYSFYCDMKDSYNEKQISEFLDINLVWIYVFKLIYKIR